MKVIPKKGFLNKIRLGEKTPIPRMNMMLASKANIPEIVKHELINFLLFFLPPNFINEKSMPRKDAITIRLTADISVDARPISSTVKSLAFIVQKTNPKSETATELAISQKLDAYSLSLIIIIIVFFIFIYI